MAAVAISIVDGSKRYSRSGTDHCVFHSINLAVEQGEILALLGPSGCGKSTLLRAIAGLEDLTDGTIALGPGDRSTADRRDVGLVFQDAALLPWLTVEENVGLGLRYRANRRAVRPGAVEALLAEFGIRELAHRYPDELSGGQAQRVSIARSIITRPRVILLDEPFGALDPLTRASMQQWLLGIQRELDLTVMLVTHDVDEAVYLGHRVSLMSPGPGTIVRTWRTPHGAPARGSNARDEIMDSYRRLEEAERPPVPARSRGASTEQLATRVVWPG